MTPLPQAVQKMQDLPSPNFSFADVIDSTLRKRPDRGDEQHAHVSDVYGCDLATWARRRGEPMLPFAPNTLVKFEMGNAVEDTVSRAIRETYPGDSERNRRIAYNPKTRTTTVLKADEKPPAGSLVGHMDIDLDDRTVIEVKSTAFFRGKEPTEPDQHYIEQASTYAVAWNAPRFAIVIVDRISGKVLTFWFNTADFVERVRERAAEVLESTNPAIPIPPEPAPRTSWACKTCRYAKCERNPAYVAPLAQAVGV